jgi:thioester reductase-like protein
MKLFLTGGTGFLGKYLVRELASKFEHIYLLTRNIEKNDFSEFKNIVLVKGDITHPDVVFDLKIKAKISNDVTHVLHAAAFYDLKATHKDCYLQNVVGTQNVLNFLKTFKKVTSFYYVSSIAVGDDDQFFLDEASLPKRSNFKDYYSQTKYFAEKMVREHKFNENLIVRIIRPGIIVGDSQNGKMEKSDGPYYFINAFKNNSQLLKTIRFLPLSYSPNTKMPIIPVDHCAHYISLLISREDSKVFLETYHLISHQTPSIEEFLTDIKLRFDIKTKFIPVPKNLIHNTIFTLLGIPKEVIPFMFSKTSYDKSVTNNKLPEILESQYALYKDSLLK